MPLKIREKAKIDLRRKRFALRGAVDTDQYQTPDSGYIIDRDAEHGCDGPLVVAIVHQKYAQALLALMNRGDDNGFLALRPAKRAKKQRESHPDEGGSENP